ncbi:MAG: tetratricopeptide repeat protein [Acidobacteriota bacterium]
MTTVLCLSLLVAGVVLASEEKAYLGGQVTDAADRDLKDVRVTISTQGGELLAEGVSARRGKIEIGFEAPAGDYIVRLEKEGYWPIETTLGFEPGKINEVTFRLDDEATGRRNAAIAAYNRGVETLRDTEDREAALIAFEESVGFDPTLPEGRLALADAYLRASRFEESASEIDAYLELQPDDASGQRLAVQIYRLAGQTEKAQAVAAASGDATLEGNLAVAVYNEGVVALQKQDMDLAYTKFTEAVASDPSIQEAWEAIASIAYNRGDLNQATNASEKALGLDDSSRAGRRVRFLVADARGDREAARAAWEGFYEVDGDRAVDLLYQGADLDFQGGRTAQARDALERILAKRPDYADAHYKLGLLFSATDSAKAKKHLQTFLELAPEHPEAASAREVLSYL